MNFSIVQYPPDDLPGTGYAINATGRQDVHASGYQASAPARFACPPAASAALPIPRQEKRRRRSPTLAELEVVMRSGLMPKEQTIFLGLDHLPLHRNAIEIRSTRLPSDRQCKAVAGLSVFLNYRGYAVRYGVLWRLCGSLYAARPKRLILVDLDIERVAFLVLGGHP